MGFRLAAGVDGDASFEGDVLTVLADDVDGTVLAVDVEVSADERKCGGARLAGLAGAAKPMIPGLFRGGAGFGGEALGVQAGGGKQNGAAGEGDSAHGDFFEFRHATVYARGVAAVPRQFVVA